MKVLVIPDVHLKPWMFHRASELMKETKSDRAVCLMDIADDWRQQFNLDLYEQTYDAAIASCSPTVVWQMHLSAGMFPPANIMILMQLSMQ